MSRDYIHRDRGEYFEDRINYKGFQIIAKIRKEEGTGFTPDITVYGRVLNLRCKTKEIGNTTFDVSEVEPIIDEEEMLEIDKILREKHYDSETRTDFIPSYL